MQPHSHVRLHPARLAQLRALAESRQETIAETVEDLISRAVCDTELDRIPGLRIITGDNNVLLLADKAMIGLTPPEAVIIARKVEQIITGEDGKGSRIPLRGFEIIVGRRGRAVLLQIKDENNNTSFQTLTYSLARDFQRQLLQSAEFLASVYVD